MILGSKLSHLFRTYLHHMQRSTAQTKRAHAHSMLSPFSVRLCILQNIKRYCLRILFKLTHKNRLKSHPTVPMLTVPMPIAVPLCFFYLRLPVLFPTKCWFCKTLSGAMGSLFRYYNFLSISIFMVCTTG